MLAGLFALKRGLTNLVDLSGQFKGIAAKRLSAVEVDPQSSNQHEFQGIQKLKEFLGSSDRKIPSTIIYLSEDEESRVAEEVELTWYDARRNQEHRSSEYRLYYKAKSRPIEEASNGDTLIYAYRNDGSLLLIVIPEESDLKYPVFSLFGLSRSVSETLEIFPANSIDLPSSLYHLIIEAAGLGQHVRDSDENEWSAYLDSFGMDFPSTRELSSVALNSLRHNVDPVGDPDGTLIDLIEREFILFSNLERRIVSSYIEKYGEAWSTDIDAFLKYSLGVHNRRKSRAGHSLENHLEWIFLENRLSYERGARTENRAKPDFLFPSGASYMDQNFPDSDLVMLAAKTSCKDRWRQILNEAKRIKTKHLLTLQLGLSENQLDEMADASVQLVIPLPLQRWYPQGRTESLRDFISELNRKQGSSLLI